jgi:hypothetical protein
MMSEQQDPQTGETFFTRQANIRDVRNLEYNVIAEESPGNMSKRMMELQALLEMQERLPVPPEQIIEKMELSATEKERWLDYIRKQEAAQAEKQEKMENLEIQFKDREISDDEQQTENDLLLGMAKIKQAAEKDEKNMKTKYAQLDQQDKASALQFATQILQAELDERAALQEIQIDATKASQELTQDGKAASQDLSQDSSKHNQDMKFIEEKNAILIKAAEEKAEQDIKTAKAKAEQDIKMAKQKAAIQKAQGGNENGKGKQTSTKGS